jgi:hypothetical protein
MCLLRLACAATPLFAAPTMTLAQPAQISTANVYWSWDSNTPIGTATLIRSASGITAVFDSQGLPAGQAVTLWMIIFNNPEHCDSVPCANVAVAPNEFPPDLFNPGVAGDFHFASGHVTSPAGRLTLGGHLRVGELRASGRLEVGIDGGIPLMDPFKAEVLLAVHSHGPALRGTALKQQLNSFLGGCQAFLGPDGFAAGPGDVPDAVGECSTLQFSVHRAQ